MDPFIIGSLIGAGTSLLSGLIGSGTTKSVSKKQQSLEQVALEEQKRLNQFQMDEYLDKKDYDRALQERIFEREDTAMQRALQDYTEAGFSPLSALGQSANAGSIVSTSSAPSLNAPSAPDLSGMYRAVDHMVNAGHEAGARVSTFLSQKYQQDFEVNMEEIRFLNEMDKLTGSHGNEKEILKLQADLNESASEAQHIRELEKITATQEFQKTMAEFQSNLQKYLQINQQDWQSKQSELDREHQLQMQETAHDQTLEALDVQDKHKQQYEKKTLAYAWSDLTKEGKDLFIRLLNKFDPDVAKFVKENNFGGDLLMRVVSMYESALPVISDTKNLLNPLNGLFGK